MGTSEVGYGAALLAGALSFLSPCVLPLVPGYLTFMSGLSLEQLSAGVDAKARRRHAGWEAVCFVLGFSLVFTLLGATASGIGRALAAHAAAAAKVGGAVIVLFGLHMTGLVPIRWLYYQKRADVAAFRPGL